MGDIRNAYKILVGKPEGMRPLGRPRCRWEDKNRWDLWDIGWMWTKYIWLRIWTSERGSCADGN